MPNDKLEKELLRRPRPVSQNPYQSQTYTKSVPWKDEDAATRFIGGFSGLDAPGGGLAGLIGAMVGGLNPLDDTVRAAKSVSKLPQVADAFQSSGKYTPEVSDEIMRYAKLVLNKLAPTKTFNRSAAERLGRPENLLGRDMAPIGMSTPKLNKLPQVEDAFQTSGKYTPEVSSEIGRLIGEMIPDKGVKAGWQEFHKLNPEATGHVRQITLGSSKDPKGLKANWEEFKKGNLGTHRSYFPSKDFEKEWAGEVFINPRTIDTLWSPSTKANTIGHELQHHAQQMLEGAGQFNSNYNKFNAQMGYLNNPYEIEANQMGKRIEDIVRLNKLSGR